MKINVNFLSQNELWQQRIKEAAAVAEEVMSSRSFVDQVTSWEGFDNTTKNPQQIANDIRSANVTINVGFYVKHWTKAIAYEENGAVYFNRAKLNYGAGSPGNVAHEVMHALGYEHVGNKRVGNENTVPYRIGDWVDGHESAAYEDAAEAKAGTDTMT